MSGFERQARPRDRRQRLAARLAEHGLTGKRRGHWSAVDEVPWGARFVDVVRGLGPGFVLFGRYLAGRPDLLGITDALALEALSLDDLKATLPARAAEQPVTARLAAELGRPVEEVFAELRDAPAHHGCLYEAFTARLLSAHGPAGKTGGRGAAAAEVVLRLRRPGLGRALAADLEELVHLRPAFDALFARPLAAGSFEGLLAAFRATLEARLDLGAEAGALRRFGKDLVDPDLLAVPRVYPGLSTPRLAVLVAMPGRRLAARGSIEDGPQGAARELARRLQLAWLQQALVAGHVPLDGEWMELRDGRLALLGGRFEALSAAALPRLWAYLRHLAGHRLEDAHGAIAGELRAVCKRSDARRLGLRMRQLVPFRDGGWSERRDTLGELLTLHWHLAREEGFEPSKSLAALWAGIYGTAAAHGRRLDPQGDPLRTALEDLRWLVSFHRLRQLADPGPLGEALESNLASLLQVPQKLDRLLHLMTGEAGGDLRLRLRVAEDAETERRRSALTMAICLGLGMATVGILSRQLPALGVSAVWAERLSAVAFLALGALLLRTLTRR